MNCDPPPLIKTSPGTFLLSPAAPRRHPSRSHSSPPSDSGERRCTQHSDSPGPHRLGRGGTRWARPESCSALRAFRLRGKLALAPVRHRPRLTRLLSQRPASENRPSISRSSEPCQPYLTNGEKHPK